MVDERLKQSLLKQYTEEQVEQAFLRLQEARSRTEEQEKQALVRLLETHLKAHQEDDACRKCLAALNLKEARYIGNARGLLTDLMRRTYQVRARYSGWSQTPGFAGLLEGLNKAEEPLLTLHCFGEELECYAYTNVDVSQLFGVLID